MKKLILSLVIATSVLTLSSCVSSNQENLNLNLSVAQKYSDLGNNKSINLTVVDGRSDKDLLGQKRLGENLITIKSSKDLTTLIKNKISRDLEQNGFTTSVFANKSLEIKILTLNYSAYREFFTGTSKIEILLKVTAKNKDGSSFSITPSFTLDQSHFIMPLLTTDEKTINSALQEALDDVSTNQKLLDFLRN